MTIINQSFSLPSENLNYDQTLLDACDDDPSLSFLRFWVPQDVFVVLGYSNLVEQEVNLGACTEDGIPILKRCSGGGTVLQAPGCLNYAFISGFNQHSSFSTVGNTNQTLMNALCRIFKPLYSSCQVCGITDLVINQKKFSGNAQKRKRNAFLFHGSLLLDSFDLKLVSRYLSYPSKAPDYRQLRSHDAFLTTIGLNQADTIQLITDALSDFF